MTASRYVRKAQLLGNVPCGFCLTFPLSGDIFVLMDSNEVIEYIKEMSRTLARNDDPRLVEEFLPCLLTENELQEVASRWALVKLIDEGMSQRKISQKLGLSLCKITRGSKELKKDNSPFKRMIDLSRS